MYDRYILTRVLNDTWVMPFVDSHTLIDCVHRVINQPLTLESMNSLLSYVICCCDKSPIAIAEAKIERPPRIAPYRARLVPLQDQGWELRNASPTKPHRPFDSKTL